LEGIKGFGEGDAGRGEDENCEEGWDGEIGGYEETQESESCEKKWDGAGVGGKLN